MDKKHQTKHNKGKVPAPKPKGERLVVEGKRLSIERESDDTQMAQTAELPATMEDNTPRKPKLGGVNPAVIRRCPSCGSTDIIIDGERGELLYNNCGLEIEENATDTGPK